MIQLILHLIGDYITQSSWMSNNKRKATWPAFCHALIYSIPFLWIGSVSAWWVIFLTHLVIDRFGLARHLCYFKNQILSPEGIKAALYMSRVPNDEELTQMAEYYEGTRESLPDLSYEFEKWEDCKETGYHKDVPIYMARWLFIVADNTTHLAINAAAIYFLP